MQSVNEMIEGIEVVKGGHVVHLIVKGMDGESQKFFFPFDSVPPSMIVVSREGLVKLLEEYERRLQEKSTLLAELRAQIAERDITFLSLAELCNSKEGELLRLRRNTAPTPTPNLPLTFDQLKERVGKPVYRIHKDGKGMWMILVSTKESVSAVTTTQTLSLAGIFPTVDALGGGYTYYDHEVTGNG